MENKYLNSCRVDNLVFKEICNYCCPQKMYYLEISNTGNYLFSTLDKLKKYLLEYLQSFEKMHDIDQNETIEMSQFGISDEFFDTPQDLINEIFNDEIIHVVKYISYEFKSKQKDNEKVCHHSFFIRMRKINQIDQPIHVTP